MEEQKFADNKDAFCTSNCWLKNHYTVHFNCGKLCLKVAKYDAYLFCITMLVYKLFQCPSYVLAHCTVQPQPWL